VSIIPARRDDVQWPCSLQKPLEQFMQGGASTAESASGRVQPASCSRRWCFMRLAPRAVILNMPDKFPLHIILWKGREPISISWLVSDGRHRSVAECLLPRDLNSS
jgi:hypothetical protein